jgi:hypothetical protein
MLMSEFVCTSDASVAVESILSCVEPCMFAPIDNALEKILQLTAWIYDRKDGSQKQEAGLVVEQVYPIIPNVVALDENGKPSSINYSRFSAYLIEAIKSLKTEIDEIKGVK